VSLQEIPERWPQHEWPARCRESHKDGGKMNEEEEEEENLNGRMEK